MNSVWLIFWSNKTKGMVSSLHNCQQQMSRFNILRKCTLVVVLENALHSQSSKGHHIINSCPITVNHTCHAR
jgi:hypothetical protein